jgi:hypothetical protein
MGKKGLSGAQGGAHQWLRQNILGLVAIFIALSGTAVATNVASDRDAQTSAKGKRGPRGFTGPAGPPGAQGTQGIPGQNGSPDTGNDILTKLTPVDGAGSGLDADTIDGLSSAGFAISGSEGWHELGPAVSGPCIANGNFCNANDCAWGNLIESFSSGAYYRDPSGVVHLKGVVKRTSVSCTGTSGRIFVLPAGYRPAKSSVYAVLSDDQLGVIYIETDDSPGGPGGRVRLQSGNPNAWVSLDGISFRCEPSGVNGCP